MPSPTRTGRTAFLLALPFLTLAAALTGCGGNSANATAPATTAQAALLVAPEDLLVARVGSGAGGPLVTGSIQPQRRADLRSELSSVVTAVLKENGEAVRRGDLLVRLDDTALRDALLSAQESERSAGQAFDQAERQLQRLTTLRASGMSSAQAMEDAEVRRNTTQSDLAAAKVRVVQARQQLQRTEVRAPFDGLVAERKVSAGDTAQVGKELMKVMDPASLRFEGLISADAIESVRPGQTVTFRVNGFGTREFTGHVRLVSPTANPTTRQVEVLVDLASDVPPRLAGLYAEGRVAAQGGSALLLPASAIVREGDKAWAWRLDDKVLRRVALDLGERDARRGDYTVRAGVAPGDRLLRHPMGNLRDGQPVQETRSAGATASAPTPLTR